MRIGEIRHPERSQWGKPLDGVRVLAAEQMQALPFATQLMAHLGADVVKVEHPVHGESGRGAQPALVDRDGRRVGATYLRNNLNKRSIGIDLKREEGRELFLKLVEGFDCVVENFRSGWLARQGLAAEVIQQRNPRCVVASLSGFGATGPNAGRASYDIVAQASGGLMVLTGESGGSPLRGGGALGDFVGGLYLALGIVSALYDRDRTGRARVLDLSNQDCIFAITGSAATIHQGIGAAVERVGNQHPFTAPYDAHEARDGWVVVATASNRLFRRRNDRAHARVDGRPRQQGGDTGDRTARPPGRNPPHTVISNRSPREHARLLSPPVVRVERPARRPGSSANYTSGPAENERTNPKPPLTNMARARREAA